MDELIKQISQKTGISAEQARQAVESVMAFLKDRLPAPIAAQVTNLLSGAGNVAGDVTNQVGDALGGLFGKKS
jgi:uncharacterized protein (DUF2267 family)